MTVYLIPTFISDNINTLSFEAKEIAKNLDEFIVENEKSARQFLKLIQTNIRQNDLKLHLLNEHSTPAEISTLKSLLNNTSDIGILSEAGCPAVADPGADFVKMAHEKKIKVVPLSGPSSILLALMASGLSGQSFVFHGYLPRDSTQRKSKLLILEKDAQKKKQTQIFMEAPYRNQALLNDILQTCSSATMLCIACDLTSKEEFIQTKAVGEWKKKVPDTNKKPVIFLIGKILERK